MPKFHGDLRYESGKDTFRAKYKHSDGGEVSVVPKVKYWAGDKYFLFEGDFNTHVPNNYADLSIDEFETNGGPVFIDVQTVLTDLSMTTLNRPIYDARKIRETFSFIDRRLRSVFHPKPYKRFEALSISTNAPIDKLHIKPPEEQPIDLSKFYPCYNVVCVPMVPKDTDVKSGLIHIYPNKDENGGKVLRKKRSGDPDNVDLLNYEENSLIFILIQIKIPPNGACKNCQRYCFP